MLLSGPVFNCEYKKIILIVEQIKYAKIATFGIYKDSDKTRHFKFFLPSVRDKMHGILLLLLIRPKSDVCNKLRGFI
jgi:hypothetical protein